MATGSLENSNYQRTWSTPAYEFICDSGWFVINLMTVVGEFSLFCLKTFQWMLTRLPRKETLLPNLFDVGVLSLPVVSLTGLFIGVILAVQSYFQFQQLGLETRLGAVINMSLVRELGPVLAATMLAGRVGSRLAAQLGTMRVTEQIDALDSMGADPIHYLVVPRFLACFFVIPSLTIMADFMGVIGGYAYSIFVLGIDKHHYLYNSQQFVSTWDFSGGILKSFVFGAIIALISCYRGFTCQPGADGVGQAATAAFVQSFVLILASDFFMNVALDAIYFALWPQGASFL